MGRKEEQQGRVLFVGFLEISNYGFDTPSDLHLMGTLESTKTLVQPKVGFPTWKHSNAVINGLMNAGTRLSVVVFWAVGHAKRIVTFD